MDDIAKLIKDKNFTEPPEIKSIKNFILSNYDEKAKVSIQKDSIVISVGSSSLANVLRLNSQELIKSCHITKRLLFRIN
jgi:hypothetical protein